MRFVSLLAWSSRTAALVRPSHSVSFQKAWGFSTASFEAEPYMPLQDLPRSMTYRAWLESASHSDLCP